MQTLNIRIIISLIVMSEDILRRSKLLVYFQISPSVQNQSLPHLYTSQPLPLSLYHFHYPSLYYPKLFTHFKSHFPPQITPNNLILTLDTKQLPYDLPIGLFVSPHSTLKVSYDRDRCVAQGFKLMMLSWKKGYTMVNREGGCDHVYKKLNFEAQKQLYQLHLQGRSHNLHKISKYQGNGIALKIIVEGIIIQRRQERMGMALRQYLRELFGQQALKGMKMLSHNIQIDLGMSLKQLLQQWNYNDGYCYLKMVQQ